MQFFKISHIDNENSSRATFYLEFSIMKKSLCFLKGGGRSVRSKLHGDIMITPFSLLQLVLLSMVKTSAKW